MKVVGKTTPGLILMKINPRGSFSNGVVFPTATPVNQNKKKGTGEYIFTPFCWYLAQNSKYKWPKVFVELFDIWKIGT